MSYLETVNKHLRGKLIQVYVGDTHEEVVYADNSKSISSVLVGYLRDVEGDCLVLDSFYMVDGEAHQGNLVFVNSINIMAICEFNGRGSFRDTQYSAALTLDKIKRP